MNAPPASADTLIATAELSKSFGSLTVLHNLGITVGEGITGLVGANGAGKTTLMRLMLGLLAPTSGQVRLLGRDPAKSSEVRSFVSYSPDSAKLPQGMPAEEFVRHMALMRRIPRAEARGRASDALWLVGLGEERARPIGTMSTGQKQRVKLAQAVTADPKLMLLDEPTEGLDPTQRRSMLELIRDIHHKHGMSVLLSSHVMAEVQAVCDHVIAIDAGSLSMTGEVADLIRKEREGQPAELVIQLTPDAATNGSATRMADSRAKLVSLLTERGVEVVDVGDEFDQLSVLWSVDADVKGRPELVGEPNFELRYEALCELCTETLAESGARLRSMRPPIRTLEDAVAEAVEEGAGMANITGTAVDGHDGGQPA